MSELLRSRPSDYLAPIKDKRTRGNGRGHPFNVEVIPPVQLGGTVPSPVLAGQNSIAETQLTVCALNEVLRYGYGRNRVGALLLQPVVYGQVLLMPFIIGRGPINQVLSLEAQGSALDPSIDKTIYLGAASQAIDPWLADAWAHYSTPSRTYADTLNGISWGVLKIPPNPALLVTDLAIDAEWLKLYDPRQDTTNGGSGSQRLADPTTWTFSKNPVLVLTDFLKSAAYGRGETMDWPSVITCANVADQTIPTTTQKRRECGVMIDAARELADVEETLRAYAGVFIVREGGVTYLVPDAPASSVFAFTNAAGSANYLSDSIKLVWRKRVQTATVVTVKWTDTSQKPWRELGWTEPQGSLPPGTEFREEIVSMPGIQDVSQARREAIRRLNEYTLCDMSATLLATGEAAQLRRGDVVTLTDSEGLTAKKMRLMGHAPAGPGLWNETLVEYDDLLYSDAVATEPPGSDTTMPLPTNPPAVTGVSAAEDVYPVAGGFYASRFIVTWTTPSWPQSFIDHFVIEVLQDSTLVHTGTASAGDTSYTTPALQEFLSYTINVSIVSSVSVQGPLGPSSSWSGYNNKKKDRPSDVVSLTAYEVNGEVHAQIVPASDVDMTAHEYRYANAYGAATDATSIESQWEDAGTKLIDRIPYPSVLMVTKVLAAGNWRLMVKGLDSVRTATNNYGQESVNAKWFDLVVTSDANAFIAGSGSFANPYLKNFALREGRWVTEFGDTWNSLFTTTPMDSNYPLPVQAYHGSGTAVLLTEYADIGALVTGEWRGIPDYTALNGSAAWQLELIAAGDAPKTITGATNATPIVMTVVGHGYTTGDEVLQSGVLGNTAANGRFWITVTDADHYSLQTFAGANVAGNGTWSAGGTQQASRWAWVAYPTGAVKTAARYARIRITTTGTSTASVNNPAGSYQTNVVARPIGGIWTGVSAAPGSVMVRFPFPVTKLVSLAVSPIEAGAFAARADKIEVSAGRMVQANANALRFDSTKSQYVSVADNAANRVTPPFTVECWFRTLATPSAPQVMFKRIASDSSNMWQFQVNANQTLRAAMIAASSEVFYVETPYAVTDGTWHHAALVATTAGGVITIKLYVDGIFIGSNMVTATFTSPTVPIAIGCQYFNSVPSNYFDGEIAECRIWNDERTQAEIQANMASAIANPSGDSSLKAYYQLKETSGTSAPDTSATANNGTLTYGAGGSVPSWRPLDGFDGYVYDSSWAYVAKQASYNGSGV